jgi:hypothetical protein
MIGTVWSAASSSRDEAGAIGAEIADLIVGGLAPREEQVAGRIWAEPANNDGGSGIREPRRQSGASA